MEDILRKPLIPKTCFVSCRKAARRVVESVVVAQASIQDWRLLMNLEETPCVYLRQAFIQMWLLFKDLQYTVSGEIGTHVIK